MRLRVLLLTLLLLIPGCLGSEDDENDTIIDGEVSIEVWYTFAAESKEEDVFLAKVSRSATINDIMLL